MKSLVIVLFILASVTVLLALPAQEEQQPPKDEGSQQLVIPPQIAQRYTPQFVKYATENIIRVDHMILDEEGNLTKWCAIAVENKETGELLHCIN